jgi:hypothetical protein
VIYTVLIYTVLIYTVLIYTVLIYTVLIYTVSPRAGRTASSAKGSPATIKAAASSL